jgi:hypothetical protein
VKVASRIAVVLLALLPLFVGISFSCGRDIGCERRGRVGPRGGYMLYHCADGTMLLVPVGPIPAPSRGVPT